MGPIPPTWPAGAEHADTLQRRLVTSIRGPLLLRQFGGAARILPANELAAQQLNFSQSDAGRIRVLPFGVDTMLFPQQPPHPPEDPTILFLSNLWRRKGIFTLLEAFARVHALMPQARLIIAGTGTDAAEVESQVRTHPGRRRITLSGAIAREHVPAMLAKCTVFCVPSLGEPFGMAALEAMSSGRPFVGTCAGGLPYLACPQGSILVEPDAAGPLAEALLRVLKNPVLATLMGRENARHVRRYYSWESVLDRLEAVYQDVQAQESAVSYAAAESRTSQSDFDRVLAPD
jgi:glycosyltransferase involved in cell wall biosynthesis